MKQRFCTQHFVFPSQQPRKIPEVTIAVPFSLESPSAPAIYVPARVVNISEIAEQKIYRCGVAFLPVAGTRAPS